MSAAPPPPLLRRLRRPPSCCSPTAAGVALVMLLGCAGVYATTTSTTTPVADRPPPRAVYLTHGMNDRVDCPAEAQPPSTLIVWSRDGDVLETTSSRRLSVDKRGALVIDNVTSDDAGLYTCTQYSPVDSRHPSFNITVVVKGNKLLLY